MPVLDFYGVGGHGGASKWGHLGIELCFFAGFFLLAWLALAFCRHSKR